MDNDERKILDALLTIHKDTNERITRFTRYILIVLVTVVISLSITICYTSKTNSDLIIECTRLYFETPYEYPVSDVSQSQTIGDIKWESQI